MSLANVFMIVPSPILSALIWIVVLAVLLYLARTPVHRVFLSASRGLYRVLRLSAFSVLRAEKRIADRNREVLLAQGREAAERQIEREFDRVDQTVHRELAGYPELHRRMTEEITAIEEEHKNSQEVPPSPPGWTEAVDAVARIPANGDPMVGNVLDDIRKSLEKAHEKATSEYRRATAERHKLLERMRPHWRSLQQQVSDVDKTINSLLDRSRAIDRQMEEYEETVRGTDRAVRRLSSSTLTQFFISLFVMLIAIGGAIINFNLIARPMAEMVGGTNDLAGFRTADIAAMVIIFVEVSMGLFLMESMRVTRLFPVIGSLSDKQRHRMAWITFTILFALASVEAGLAYMREILMEQEMATQAILSGGAEASAESSADSVRWITTASQMGLGFILPFALVFVAIPLETFVQSLRTVLGIAAMGILRVAAFLLRVLGSGARYAGQLLVDLYDLLIFAPLWVEHRLMERGDGGDGEQGQTPRKRPTSGPKAAKSAGKTETAKEEPA
ncbi:hypothetical protein [Thiohalorhabdus denitrificans]|uniref:Uncharacterized protein n=1 Tax=Thiohalorhabdus denitrificans TaxID=381306 RepID=A0A1G5ABI4_9GAMM|nr:hypothetical protein [Thiohalorhabdus denitrificans]SCX75216.1 hypothetical protein SAMN05661077_0219 [Thiohalorhabdus denitrificans]